MKTLKAALLGLAAVVCAPLPALAQNAAPGATPATALENCQALLNAGVALSGTYWIRPSGGAPRTAYCDMETNGGGWTLVYNSVLGVNVTEFWNISHWERFGRRGHPRLESLFYDGSLYQYGRTYMDVIEDLRGKSVVALLATANGIDPYSMRFISPQYVSGNPGIYIQQFASGWSSPDFDGDTYSTTNCANLFGMVSQHYGGCFYYNLGVQDENPYYDAGVGPHLNSATAGAIGLYSEGGHSTRVRRIARYVKW